jgi:hypothetical protein
VPLMAQVDMRTAIKRTDASLIIMFFFIFFLLLYLGSSPRIIYPSRENIAGHLLLAFAHRGECRGIIYIHPQRGF